MSIEKVGFGYVVSCDSCSNYLEQDNPKHEFCELLVLLRSEDWRSIKRTDGYEHICPDCQRKQVRP
jgi:hypothetical protein